MKIKYEFVNGEVSEIEVEDLAAEEDLLQDLIDEEDHERLMAAIAKLQPQQRDLLYRVYWNGEKQKDIAA